MYLRSHCLFLEKEHFPFQAHPPLDNPAVRHFSMAHALPAKLPSQKIFFKTPKQPQPISTLEMQCASSFSDHEALELTNPTKE